MNEFTLYLIDDVVLSLQISLDFDTYSNAVRLIGLELLSHFMDAEFGHQKDWRTCS